MIVLNNYTLMFSPHHQIKRHWDRNLKIHPLYLWNPWSQKNLHTDPSWLEVCCVCQLQSWWQIPAIIAQSVGKLREFYYKVPRHFWARTANSIGVLHLESLGYNSYWSFQHLPTITLTEIIGTAGCLRVGFFECFLSSDRTGSCHEKTWAALALTVSKNRKICTSWNWHRGTRPFLVQLAGWWLILKVYPQNPVPIENFLT